MTVDHSISDIDVENVTFTFRVRKAYLETSGVSADSISLFRNETTRWNQLPTNVVGETDDYYVFEATSPGLSVFSIGSSTAMFEVTDAQVILSEVSTGEKIRVTATVVNHGNTDGTYTAALTVDGEVVMTTDVDVPARSEQQVGLTQEFAVPGRYNLTVANVRAGEVHVQAQDQSNQQPEQTADAETQSDSTGANVWPTVIVVVVVGATLVVWYRRQEDDVDK